MSGTTRSPEKKIVSPAKRLAQLIVLAVLGALAALGFEHWRGERALRIQKQQLILQGEILAPDKLWPTPSVDAAAFSNQLAAALQQLPNGLNKYSGYVCGMDNDGSGQLVRSSKLPIPLGLHRATASTWSELNSALEEGEPGLQAIRELMRNPPRSTGRGITNWLEIGYTPNFIGTRVSAQYLATVVVNDLHEGNLDSALKNLEALQGCVRLNADEPTLVNFMVRVAVLGLGSSAGWDALQESGWTEPQLLRFQEACQANELFSQIPKVVAAERLARFHSFNWFASHHYQEWVDLYSDILKSFGARPSDYQGACWQGPWRQWVFHPVWSYAWRAQEEMDFLRFSQDDLGIVREAVQRGAWNYLKTQQAALRDKYHRPPAHWRFYESLPMHNEVTTVISGGTPVAQPECPYPNYSSAWRATARNLNSHEMMITAIALRRYHRQHGRMPGELAALVPAYLKAVPRDIVDGQPLRYRLNADGSFTLYSIGEDATDDGGDKRPPVASSSGSLPGFSSGRDWLWPQLAAAVEPSKP